MYWRISVLWDTCWNNVENVLKVYKKCSGTKSDVSTKGERPTYLTKLGPSVRRRGPGPTHNRPYGRRLRGGATWGWATLGVS